MQYGRYVFIFYFQVDFILVSRDSLKFHNENLLRNHAHYSCLLGLRGAEKITAIQVRRAARIYYNTLVENRGDNTSSSSYNFGL
jgi:hypothetical protein